MGRGRPVPRDRHGGRRAGLRRPAPNWTRPKNITPTAGSTGSSTACPSAPTGVARYLDEKIEWAGADVLLLTQAVDVVLHSGRITHVVIFNKSGLAAVPARAVIDATGDADMAARSGCEYVKGREEDHLMTPATLEFHVSHVDKEKLTCYIEDQRDPKLREKIKELRERGIWTFPYDIFICTQLTEPDTFYVNTIRLVGIDGTDGRSVSEGMVRGRQEAERLFRILREHIPGFETAQLKTVAPLLGVRETRRIVADSIMTVEDLSRGEEFPDTIGFSMYGWDLPDVKRPSVQPYADDSRAGYKYKVKKGSEHAAPLPGNDSPPDREPHLSGPGRLRGTPGPWPGSRDGPLHGHGRGRRHGRPRRRGRQHSLHKGRRPPPPPTPPRRQAPSSTRPPCRRSSPASIRRDTSN